LLQRLSSAIVIINCPDSLLIFKMFPEHGDIFIYNLFKQKMHEVLAEWNKLLPVKQKQPANSAKRSSFHPLDK